MTETEEKKNQLSQLRTRVEQIHDRLNKGVDPGIKETLVYLWANDFDTSSSCEGHFNQGLGGPWVDIGKRIPRWKFDKAPTKEKILMQIAKALNKTSLISNKLSRGLEIRLLLPYTREMKKQDKILRRENLRQMMRLADFLDEFYKNRKISNDVRLIIEGGRTGRLISQGARFREIRSKEEKEEKLKMYKEEMAVFTNFLKNKYFEK